ncbi:MAG: UDP-glucose/GDP-mannose dehydrogenase family protein [Alphaproteobacteria bacterium]|nr:UDP-glucose/GDP-mannose dehydrogenase family protein [Alphaproteobacteria bacterium]
MRIAMVGTGYVGLVSGACFSEFGWSVTCVDRDREKIARLEKGEIPIFEPGLGPLVEKGVADGRLKFTTNLTQAVAQANIVFIAVGTPSRRGDGHADLSHVFCAAREIAAAIKHYTVIVTKSTVPVGTSRKIAQLVREVAPKAEFDVVSNPEFLREGSAITDFMRPDRVVIGSDSARAVEAMKVLYRPLYLLETPVVVTSLESSELTKYAANAFLATKITFINQIADLAERVGADVQDVAKGIGLDGRIGRKFLHAGPGFGGSCLPKDLRALLNTADEAGAELTVIAAVAGANEARKADMARRILDACQGIKKPMIAVLGVAFKPGTDDMREAPSLEILPRLQQAGAKIRAFDPAAMAAAEPIMPGVHWCSDAYDAMQDADVVVLLTEWNEFRGLDLERARRLMRTPVMVDLRNVYTPAAIAAAGFKYTSIGRRSEDPAQKSSL